MSDDDRQARIWRAVHTIPAGHVSSYGRIAAIAGLPGCARLVGRTLSQLPAGSQLPWHRVVNAKGRISFAEGSDAWLEQYRRLRAEGVELQRGRVDWSRYGWP